MRILTRRGITTGTRKILNRYSDAGLRERSDGWDGLTMKDVKKQSGVSGKSGLVR